VNGTTNSPTLVLAGASAVSSTATITGTGTGPTVIVNQNQNFGTLANTGTTDFYNGSSTTIGTINNSGTMNIDSASTVTATTAFAEGMVNNAGTVNINDSSSTDSINTLSGAGTLIVGASTTLAVNNSLNHGQINNAGNINVNGGANNIVGQGNGIGTGANGGSGPTTGGISGAGTFSVNSGNLTASVVRQGVLTIGSSSTVTIADSSGPGNTASVSVLTDLNNSGTLDLKNNDMIINDTNSAVFPAVQAAIANAWNNGAWNQSGITSSSAKANSSEYGLGYATGAELGTTSFDNQSITSGSTVVKYTLLGDAALTGQVNSGDLGTVLDNIGAPGDWSQGNFHYGSGASAAVNSGDLGALLNNIGANASGNLVSGNLAKSNLVTRSFSPALTASPDVTPPQVASNSASDLKLVVNTSNGDVSLADANPNVAVSFTSYTILVNDNTINTLVVGNPSDTSKATGPAKVLPRVKNNPGPFTSEKLLSETNSSSGNYNSSAAALEATDGITDPQVTASAWSTALDGFNPNQSAFGLIENWGSTTVTATITIPVGGSVDLGNIFNTLASQTDLTFDWEPANTVVGTGTETPNWTGQPYLGASIDYVGSPTPEPGTLGILGLGGVMMMRRRRRATVAVGTGANGIA
jgi:hypothetical protein